MSSLRLVCVAAFVVVAVLVCANASPEEQTDSPGAKLAGAIRRVLNVVGLKPASIEGKQLVKRQSFLDCNFSADCFPPSVNNAPASLIFCDADKLCVCNECFELSETGQCELNDCEDYQYDRIQRECVDDRRSQQVAFLLSFFLSPTGAANFYIGQTDVGIGQLLLLQVLIVFPCVAGCIVCCLGCCSCDCLCSKDTYNDWLECGSPFTKVCFLMATLVAFLGGVALWTWWLVDLIHFATNERDAGNGCPLRNDL